MFYGLQSERENAILNSLLGMLKVFYPRTFASDHLITVDRCMGFIEDKDFMEAFQKAVKTDQDKSLIWRVHTLAWAADHCKHLEGDFVECGVYKGFCSFFLVNYLDFGNMDRSFYLYDTFAGIPEAYKEGSPVRDGAYSEPNLLKDATERFASFDNVKVIEGVVPEVLEGVSPEKIAFLHLDMNSALSELGALEVLFDRIVPGGMIVFDDYGWQSYRAQKQAEDEFMRQRDYKIMELPTGQGLLVKR